MYLYITTQFLNLLSTSNIGEDKLKKYGLNLQEKQTELLTQVELIYIEEEGIWLSWN